MQNKSQPIFEFEIQKDAGEGKPEKTQDQAINEALTFAKSNGYNQISLQTHTPNGYWFMAYDKI